MLSLLRMRCAYHGAPFAPEKVFTSSSLGIHQPRYSDFGRFPGILYFSNLPELMCMSASLDVQSSSVQMKKHNEESLVHLVTFWTYSVATLLR